MATSDGEVHSTASESHEMMDTSNKQHPSFLMIPGSSDRNLPQAPHSVETTSPEPPYSVNDSSTPASMTTLSNSSHPVSTHCWEASQAHLVDMCSTQPSPQSVVSDEHQTLPGSHNSLQEGNGLSPLLLEIDEFIQAQDEVTSLRVQAAQERKILGRSRNRIANCDAAFMDELRKLYSAGALPDALDPLFEACQSARDEFGPLEDDYEKRDFSLVPKEFGLKRRSDLIREKYSRIDRSRMKVRNNSDPHSRSSSRHSGSSFDDYQYSPFTSAVYWYSPKDDTTTLPQPEHNQGPGKDTQSTDPFNNLTENSKAFKSKDIRAHIAVPHRETTPVDQFAPDLQSGQHWGLSHSASSINKPAEYMADRDLDGSEPTAADIIDEGEDQLLDRTTGSHRDLDEDPKNAEPAHSRINFWLLHRLRTSRWEIRRFREAVIVETRNLQGWTTTAWRWWDFDKAALRLWDSDQAAKPPPSTASTTESDRLSTWDTSNTQLAMRRPRTLNVRDHRWFSPLHPKAFYPGSRSLKGSRSLRRNHNSSASSAPSIRKRTSL